MNQFDNYSPIKKIQSDKDKIYKKIDLSRLYYAAGFRKLASKRVERLSKISK